MTQPVYNGLELQYDRAELIVFQAPCTNCTYKLGEILFYLWASLPMARRREYIVDSATGFRYPSPSSCYTALAAAVAPSLDVADI